MKRVKITFAVYVQNNGDGSVSARFFRDEEAAERVAEQDNERYSEDVQTHELVVDAQKGEILSGLSE